jgi:hypothetical protein
VTRSSAPRWSPAPSQFAHRARLGGSRSRNRVLLVGAGLDFEIVAAAATFAYATEQGRAGKRASDESVGEYRQDPALLKGERDNGEHGDDGLHDSLIPESPRHGLNREQRYASAVKRTGQALSGPFVLLGIFWAGRESNHGLAAFWEHWWCPLPLAAIAVGLAGLITARTA